MSNDLTLLSAHELVEQYRSRKLSPVEVTKAVFSAIQAYNPVLNAFAWLDENGALAQARSSEARWAKGEPAGLLDGVPVSVKDLSFTAGLPTRRGTTAISVDGDWTEDAPSVARVREHGGVVYGKTTVPEFAAKIATYSNAQGVTRNPWNPALTPGGSSGGAAAALASGMGTLALASDAAGSIRVPSAFTGLYGLKPTFGRVPDYPASYLGSIAVIGPMARTVGDCALLMDVISKTDLRDPYSYPTSAKSFGEQLSGDLKGLRIAYSPTLGFAKIDPEISALVERAAMRFRDAGATVETVDYVVDDPSGIIWPTLAVGLANAFRWLGFSSEQIAQVEPGLLQAADQGSKMLAVDHLEVRRAQERLAIQMESFHKRFDLLLTPASVLRPFTAEQDPMEGSMATVALNAVCNLSGQPAASVPCGLTSDGLPVGMQIIGARHADALVLKAALVHERNYPFVAPNLRKVSEYAAANPTR